MGTTKKSKIGIADQIGISKIYEEACSAKRLYSQSITTIRITAIAQGLAILSAIGFLTKDGQFALSLLSAILGLALTIILYQLNRHYFHLSLTTIEYVGNLERKHSVNNGGGWSTVVDARSKLWSKWIVRFCMNKAIFFLLSLAMLGILVFDLLKLFSVT